MIKVTIEQTNKDAALSTDSFKIKEGLYRNGIYKASTKLATLLYVKE